MDDESEDPTSTEPESGFDAGFEGHNARQARLGLTLKPAERLQWLEHKNAEMRALLGRASRRQK